MIACRLVIGSVPGEPFVAHESHGCVFARQKMHPIMKLQRSKLSIWSSLNSPFDRGFFIGQVL
jgi:hypothetical protein